MIWRALQQAPKAQVFTDPDFPSVVQQFDFTRLGDGTANIEDNVRGDRVEYRFEGDAEIASGALSLDGSGDLIRVATNVSADLTAAKEKFDFGTGDFTLEVWLTLDAALSGDPKHVWSSMGLSGNRGTSLTLKAGDKIKFASSPNGSSVNELESSTISLSTSTDYYFCVCRHNGTARIFYSAMPATTTNVYSAANTDDIQMSSTDFPLAIGGGWDRSGSRLNGKIEALRVTDAARFTADTGYTPDSLPLYDPLVDGYGA